MENQKNNKGVIALLVIIIVILSALCVLFATGTISFNSNEVNDNDVSENVNDNNENNDIDNDNYSENIRYYQYYITHDNNSNQPTYSSREIELNSDGSARWRFGGNASGGENYKGTYTEDSNTIILTLEREMQNNTTCDDNNTVFPCNTTLTLNKNNDKSISSINELGSDGLSYIYKPVEKSELYFFNNN